jgi:hypothetical protein
MKKLVPILAASMLLGLGSAHAQLLGRGTATTPGATPTTYGELGWTRADVETSGAGARSDLLRGIVGYNFHPNAAAEAMLGIGIRDSGSTTLLGVPADLKVKHVFGAYVKPKLQLTDNIEVFGRLGLAQTRHSISTALASRTDRDWDLSYGVGLNFNINPQTYVGLDWMSYLDKGSSQVDGMTLSVGMRF